MADKQYLFFMRKHSRNIQYKHTSITTSKEIKTNNSMNLQMLWLERFLRSLVSQSQCNCYNPQESQNENLEIKMKTHKNYKMKTHNKVVPLPPKTETVTTTGEGGGSERTE